MNIAIDLGNSSAKIGRFEHGELLEEPIILPFHDLPQIVNAFNPTRTIVSSVNQDVGSLKATLKNSPLILDHNTPLPFSIKYATPTTLGKDRIAAIAGALATMPNTNTNTLVVDIGTCITYDFVTSENDYLGGGISPGIEMRLKAMHTFTANLPLVNFDSEVDLIGNTTETSLQSGAIHGAIAEIEEIARMYKHKFPHLRFIICGGGADFVGSRLKTKVEIRPELVLRGLNSILEYNV